jgi:acyl-CoA thioester hydrolase
MNLEAPLALHTDVVRPEWIDYNGHMNLAFFVMAFDFATDAFFDHLGADEAYRDQTGYSLFLLETHVNYLNQMREGDGMRFETQLLDYDHKRVHYFHRMYHAERAYLAATTELLFVHVDTTQDRSIAIPAPISNNLAALMDAHRNLERPAEVGRVMGIRKKNLN